VLSTEPLAQESLSQNPCSVESDPFPPSFISAGLSPVNDEVGTYLTKDFTVTRIVFRCRVSGIEGGKTPGEACDLPNKLQIASFIRLGSLCMPLVPPFCVEGVAVIFFQIDGVRVR